MSRLFFRVFGVVCITVLISVIAAVVISTILFVGAFDEDRFGAPRELTQQAAEQLERGGRENLIRWLKSDPTPRPDQLLLIIDDDGRELLGRRVPGRWERIARRSQSRDTKWRPRNYRPSRILPRIVGPEGDEYLLIFAPRRFTALTLLGWPPSRLPILAAMLLVAATMSYLLARYIAGPVFGLSAATRAFADGDLSARVGGRYTQRKDELGELARDFDAMADRIQELIEEREDLLRDVSHELRSPLTRLRLALAIAERAASANEPVDLSRIEKETEILQALVDQIMGLVRLRSGPELKKEPVRVDQLIDDVVADAGFEYGEERIDWPGTAATIVHGHANSLRSAFENVLRNALRYSPASEHVNVELLHQNGLLNIVVSDRGPGVPDELLERIFEPLFRVDTSRTRDSGGEGIGLAIAARVCELHGGHITAHNRDGGGLTVKLQLPASPPNNERGP